LERQVIVPTELDTLLDPYEADEHLPPEMLLDKDHPKNDQYYKSLQKIERSIRVQGNLLNPNQREVARLTRTGIKTRDIAKKLNIAPATVRKYNNNPDVLRLRSLLDHYQHLQDGPNIEHRKAILYRIVLDNEVDKPNIAIQGIQEINKMSGSYENQQAGNNGNVFNIQINGDLLPRGGLDVLPETYESRKLIEGEAEEV
jgi:hypothetical protein